MSLYYVQLNDAGCDHVSGIISGRCGVSVRVDPEDRITLLARNSYAPEVQISIPLFGRDPLELWINILYVSILVDDIPMAPVDPDAAWRKRRDDNLRKMFCG